MKIRNEELANFLKDFQHDYNYPDNERSFGTVQARERVLERYVKKLTDMIDAEHRLYHVG